jgi:hypothetical protein
MLVDEKIYLDEDADGFFRNLIKSMYDNRDKNFGNARAVRKLVGEIIHKQHLRLASMSKESRTPDLIDKITVADIQSLTSEDISKRQGMGFKLG